MTAATGRQDYDQTVKLSSLQPGEPIFVLRAQDAAAADAVRAWAAIAHGLGAPAEALEMALQQADRMAAWPDKKAPDGPDLAEGSRKQLRNQFARRAWNMRDAAPDISLVMAEQLGRADVVGRLRPLVSAVADRTRRGPGGELVYSPPADRASCPLDALFRLLGASLDARLAVREGGA